MPLCLTKTLRENTQLAVWRISESMDELAAMMHPGIKDPDPRPQHRHWLASRLTLGSLFPRAMIELSKDPYNKPSLLVDQEAFFVSISHSFDRAAVIVSPLLPVAIDLEKLDHRIERVQHKFAATEELEMIAESYRREMLTVIWSAKETMYKLYGKKEVDFRREIRVDPFTWDPAGFALSARLSKGETELQAEVNVQVEDDYVLTWVC
jgi:phosphopantetheinyl transferase